MADLVATSGIDEAFDLSGRVAVLTGAASGIGRSTAQVLSGAGATVVLGDIDEKGAQATADEIGSRGGTALPLRTDVTKRSDIDALVDRAAGDYGRVDIMGNIAGIPHNQMVADVTDEDFERILAINLKSVFYGCQAALRVMTPQKSGSIINISSGAIDTPAPTLACYAMTKAAVAMLTKTLAMEAGQAGIRVNALAPGVILTNFSRQHFVDADGTVNEERLQQYKQRFGAMSPLGRIGTPEDIAWTILYLVSDAASFVTGQPQRRRLDALVATGRSRRRTVAALRPPAPPGPRWRRTRRAHHHRDARTPTRDRARGSGSRLVPARRSVGRSAAGAAVPFPR